MNKLSLYELDVQLTSIIDEIIENDGEVTEELAEMLEITQENFDNKLESYINVITEMNNFIDKSKCEKKRINTLQKTRENIVEKLKLRIKDAVLKYGNPTKDDNKSYDLPTHKLYTRTTESVNIDDIRVNKIYEAVISVIKTNYDSYPLREEDLLEPVNDILTGVYEIEPITIDDLKSLKFDIHKTYNINTLINSNIIKDMIEEGMTHTFFHGELVTDKSELKDRINLGQNITYAKVVKDKSLTIK